MNTETAHWKTVFSFEHRIMLKNYDMNMIEKASPNKPTSIQTLGTFVISDNIIFRFLVLFRPFYTIIFL